MNKNEASIGKELVRTVTSDKLADVVFDIAEVALDASLSEGVFKDLPIVGTIVKLLHAGKSISEALFIRKLFRFLTGLQNVPIQEREKLLAEYPDKSEKQKILGENLLLALERLDDVEKPSILARFFTAYIKSEIDYITFTRLARSLEKFNLALLPNLRWFYTYEEPRVDTPEEVIHELSLAGLALVSLEGSGTIGGSASYLQSSLGKEFLRLGFEIEVQDK